jgi:predicted 3-demethylubiquinone-9 3-methyltransferase (glyoxalase superfamily)
MFQIDIVSRFTATAQEFHRQEPGSVMSVVFTLNGQRWFALNSRPKSMPMTEAVSFQIICDGQDQIDHYWDKLTEGISEEDQKKQMCGWLRDRFGVSWQVVSKLVEDVMSSGDEKKMAACMGAFMKMTKVIEKDVREAVEATQG